MQTNFIVKYEVVNGIASNFGAKTKGQAIKQLDIISRHNLCATVKYQIFDRDTRALVATGERTY
jgi:hypothetical protein